MRPERIAARSKLAEYAGQPVRLVVESRAEEQRCHEREAARNRGDHSEGTV